MIGSLFRWAAVSDSGRYRVTLINLGWVVVAAALVLSAVGVYAIDVAMQGPGAGWDLAPRALRQVIYLVVSLLAAGFIAIPHYRLIGVLAPVGAVIVLGLLVVLLVPIVPASIVKAENGARSWINIPGLRLQPSELAKIAFVLVVARYLRFRAQHRRFPGLVPPAMIAAVPVLLIILQPDLGTASLFVPALFAMLVAAGARLRHLGLIVLIACLAAPAVYPALRPHQKARIQALLNQVTGERSGAQTINYQGFVAQTYIGAGGAAGVGDARARTLIEYNYLPAKHNDMIFSVICLRFGWLGATCVLLLYLAWFVGALAAAALCKDPFGRLVIVGLAAFIGAQVVINIGMNVGVLPIIGITLPFLSAGGSSVLTCWLMTGLILNVAMRKPIPPFRPSFEFGE